MDSIFFRCRSAPTPRVGFGCERINVKKLDLVPGPARFAQELQAGLYGWVFGKAVDTNTPCQTIPSEPIHQLGDSSLKRNAVQRVVGLRMVHTNQHTTIKMASGTELAMPHLPMT